MVDRLSLAELSERAEVAPRTVRFYIAQGLLPGPLRSGRAAEYGDRHLRLLTRIKELQAEGLTLAEVAFALDPGRKHRELADPVAWLEYELAEDVIVRIRGDVSPWRHKAIQNVLSEATAKLREEAQERKKK